MVDFHHECAAIEASRSIAFTGFHRSVWPVNRLVAGRVIIHVIDTEIATIASGSCETIALILVCATQIRASHANRIRRVIFPMLEVEIFRFDKERPGAEQGSL